jgi:hypothetical protein
VSTGFLIRDNGEPDPIAPQAEQFALENWRLVETPDLAAAVVPRVRGG